MKERSRSNHWRLPTVGHTVAVRVPASRIFVNNSVTVIVVRQTISITVVVRVGCIDKTVFIVIETVGANVSYGVLIAENDAPGSVASGISTTRLVELHSIFLVPIVDRNGAVPPDTVVKTAGVFVLSQPVGCK